MMLWLDASSCTEAGPHRKRNEDRVLCLPSRGLFAVVDGVGGRPCGEEAAQFVVDVLGAQCVGPPSLDTLREALYQGHARLLAESLERGLDRSMAAVATVLWVDPAGGKAACWAHVGDTRLHRIARYGAGEQLTVDDTDEPRQDGESCGPPVHGHRVNRALGGSEGPLGTIQGGETTVSHGDAMVLCSDGVSDVLERGEIAALVSSCWTARGGVRRVVGAVNQILATRPVSDNYSIVVVRNAWLPRLLRAFLPSVIVTWVLFRLSPSLVWGSP